MTNEDRESLEVIERIQRLIPLRHYTKVLAEAKQVPALPVTIVGGEHDGQSFVVFDDVWNVCGRVI